MHNYLPKSPGRILTCLFIFFSFATLFTGCTSTETHTENNKSDAPVKAEKTDERNSFVKEIEKADKSADFKKFDDVEFDVALSFGGSPRMKAHIAMATNMTRIKIEKGDGTTLVYDGSKGYIAPDTSSLEGARFDLFTWPYFFSMPYKLSDPGTNYSKFNGTDSLNGTAYNTQKLTFNSDIGDSPDDWYVLYSDRQSNMIAYAAYIVTAHRSAEEAEKNPHAIGYSDYQSVSGIPIAHTWTFWTWDSENGLGKEIGNAEISNLSFSNGKSERYSVPSDAKIIP